MKTMSTGAMKAAITIREGLHDPGDTLFGSHDKANLWVAETIDRALSEEREELVGALNRVLVHFVGQGDDGCPECGAEPRTETCCDTGYVISKTEEILAKFESEGHS
jgi:hypothetical protein